MKIFAQLPAAKFAVSSHSLAGGNRKWAASTAYFQLKWAYNLFLGPRGSVDG